MKQTLFVVPIPPRTSFTEWGGLPRSQIDDLRRFKRDAVLGLPDSGILLGFTLMDALRCLLSGRDPRFTTTPAPDWELVFVEATTRWFDDRYFRPGAASVASERPTLLPAHQQRWLQYATYEREQGLLLQSEVVASVRTRLPFTTVERRFREELAKRVERSQRARVLSRPLVELLHDLDSLLSDSQHWVEDFVVRLSRC